MSPIARPADLSDRLRTHLIGLIHVGQVRPGSRLPSIREVAQQHNVDHRVAARAYEILQEEGLVEIRGRSGVYVAGSRSARDPLADARHKWLVDVLKESWSRRISVPELKHLMRSITFHGLRCLCVESTTDHLVAISSELASDFGLVITPYQFEIGPDEKPTRAALQQMQRELDGIDLVATTVFHAGAIAEFARANRREFVAITINPALRETVASKLSGSAVRVVVSDPCFASRAMKFLLPNHLRNLQVVLARNYCEQHDDIPTFFTKAARRELGLAETDLITSGQTFIGPESAAEVSELIVRLSI